MALSEKSKELKKHANQGDGGIIPKKEPDKMHRVLNYPGLEYFYEKLKDVEPTKNESSEFGPRVQVLKIEPQDWEIATLNPIDRRSTSYYEEASFDAEGKKITTATFAYPLPSISYKDFTPIHIDSADVGKEQIDRYTVNFWAFRYRMPFDYTGKIVKVLYSNLIDMPHINENDSDYANLSNLKPGITVYAGSSVIRKTDGTMLQSHTGAYMQVEQLKNTIYLDHTGIYNETISFRNQDDTISNVPRSENPIAEYPPTPPSTSLFVVLEVSEPRIPYLFYNNNFRNNWDYDYPKSGYRVTDTYNGKTVRAFRMKSNDVGSEYPNVYMLDYGKDYTEAQYIELADFWKTYHNFKTILCPKDYALIYSESKDPHFNTADKLATPRQIALSGDVDGDAMFDGSGDIVIGTAVDCLTTTEIDAIMQTAMAIGG